MPLFWRCLFDAADIPAGLLLLLGALIALIAFANDDDLPGPRRCFARSSGPPRSEFGTR